MRKVFISNLTIILSLNFLLLVSCGQKPNYEMISQQNSLHPIDIIYIDKKTEELLGAFPLDRNYYAQILNSIESSHPKFVVLKFFFDKITESDKILSQQNNKFRNVLTQSTSYLQPLSEVSQNQIENVSVQLEANSLPEGDSILLPNSVLFESFLAIGQVDFKIDNNEYIDCPLATSVTGNVIPSLALRIAMLITGSDPMWVENSITLKGHSLSDEKGNMRINLSEPEALYPTYSFIDVLESEPGDYDFKDKIVIVFVDNASIRSISSQYERSHNPAEIVADSINSILMKVQ